MILSEETDLDKSQKQRRPSSVARYRFGTRGEHFTQEALYL